MNKNKTQIQPEQTINYYNGIAKGYKSLYHNEQKQKINLVKNYFLKNGTILDLGSGDGVLNQFLNLKNKNLTLYSLDISSELLALNSNKQENKILADAHKIPFPDETFNQILSFTILQDLKKPELTIKEINRTLKKEGKAILSFLKLSKKTEKIYTEINKLFHIEKKIEEEKDTILILKKLQKN